MLVGIPQQPAESAQRYADLCKSDVSFLEQARLAREVGLSLQSVGWMVGEWAPGAYFSEMCIDLSDQTVEVIATWKTKRLRWRQRNPDSFALLDLPELASLALQSGELSENFEWLDPSH
jgi:hypothetical protein